MHFSKNVGFFFLKVRYHHKCSLLIIINVVAIYLQMYCTKMWNKNMLDYLFVVVLMWLSGLN